MTTQSRYTLRIGDEPEIMISGLAAFCVANDFVEEMDDLAALPVGGECVYGGGASPLAVVRRVA